MDDYFWKTQEVYVFKQGEFSYHDYLISVYSSAFRPLYNKFGEAALRNEVSIERDGKILMERLCYPEENNGKEFFSVPGG